jgi:hypothetical protein
MTMISNISLSNASTVFTTQSAYTSFELFYAVAGLFTIFIIASFFLDGQTKPFEKLLAAIMAFIFSIGVALSTFSLAIVNTSTAGFMLISNVTDNITATTQINAIIPTIVMQNGQMWQIASWIIVLLAFVNIINCILVLIDYSRIRGVKKGGL